MRSKLICGATLAATLLVGACAGTPQVSPTRDPGLVHLEGTLANTFVAAGQTAEIVARLRIDARSTTTMPRPPVHLGLVVDTSGSMEGRPIEDARAATALLLGALEPGDHISVVAFGSTTEVLLPSTEFETGRLDELRAKVSAMRAQGTTDLAGGLRAGIEEVARVEDASALRRIVLLSDGVPNESAAVEALAQYAGQRGIAITTLGLGLDYDETLLGAVAMRSGGRFHFVEDSSAVATLFRDEVLRMRRVLGRNVSLELRPGPGVQIERVVGQPLVAADGSVRIGLGDVGEGEAQEVLVQLRADGRRPGAMVEVMDAVLVFDDAERGAGRLERRVFLGARATLDPADLARGRDTSVERDASRSLAAAVTVEAIRLARAGDLERAQAMLGQATEAASLQAIGFSDDVLAGQVEGMRELERSLPAVAPSGRSGAGAAPSVAPEAPRAVRRAHDRAMQTLQGE